MVAINADAASGAAELPVGHFGAWRVLTAVPSMAGSLLLLLVVFGWMGRWEASVLLTWLFLAAALYGRAGERLAVRMGCGFRPPTPEQMKLAAPAWSAALRRCGIGVGEVDLYVHPARGANAYAFGKRSVAVTVGVLTGVQEGRLTQEELAGVFAHELGHRATGSTSLALVTGWLAAPWRVASRLVVRLGWALAGRQPRGRLGGVVALGCVVAVVQAVQQRNWIVALVIGSVALAAIVRPLLEAAVSRRSEYVADQYVVASGLGRQLAAALQALEGPTVWRGGWTAHALGTHPPTERRIAALRLHSD